MLYINFDIKVKDMAYQLTLKNVTSCLTAVTKATETTKESSTYYLNTHNKDGNITNQSVLGNNTKSADDKTFDWVFTHHHPDEKKRVFTIKDLKVEEVMRLNNGNFTVKLNENQDFTVEYLSNETDTCDQAIGHLDFSISSI